MQVINLFLFPIILFISCTSSSENKSAINDKNGQINMDTIKLYIKSPSGKCSYELVINYQGKGYFSFKKSSSSSKKIEIKVTDEADIKLLKTLSNELDEMKAFEGKLWKDGWTYIIFYNHSKKITVYKKQESKPVNELIDLFQKYAKVKIDYNCF